MTAQRQPEQAYQRQLHWAWHQQRAGESTYKTQDNHRGSRSSRKPPAHRQLAHHAGQVVRSAGQLALRLCRLLPRTLCLALRGRLLALQCGRGRPVGWQCWCVERAGGWAGGATPGLLLSAARHPALGCFPPAWTKAAQQPWPLRPGLCTCSVASSSRAAASWLLSAVIALSRSLARIWAASAAATFADMASNSRSRALHVRAAAGRAQSRRRQHSANRGWQAGANSGLNSFAAGQMCSVVRKPPRRVASGRKHPTSMRRVPCPRSPGAGHPAPPAAQHQQPWVRMQTAHCAMSAAA